MAEENGMIGGGGNRESDRRERSLINRGLGPSGKSKMHLKQIVFSCKRAAYVGVAKQLRLPPGTVVKTRSRIGVWGISGSLLESCIHGKRNFLVAPGGLLENLASNDSIHPPPTRLTRSD